MRQGPDRDVVEVHVLAFAVVSKSLVISYDAGLYIAVGSSGSWLVAIALAAAFFVLIIISLTALVIYFV